MVGNHHSCSTSLEVDKKAMTEYIGEQYKIEASINTSTLERVFSQVTETPAPYLKVQSNKKSCIKDIKITDSFGDSVSLENEET